LVKIEENKSDNAYQNFLNNFKDTPANQKGLESFHSWKYQLALAKNDAQCFENFLKKYPNSSYSEKLPKIIEDLEFTKAKKQGNKETYEAFIKKYPSSTYIEEVKKKLDELNNGVSITVSGSGKTLDAAKQAALRSAIEQAFGTFISSKTELLNDELISDQITSVASGNIHSYEMLNESQFPDRTWGVTLKALVSISKLTSFVEAKGIAEEIKGGMFAMNIKQQLLNEQAEVHIVRNLIGTVHNLLQQSFDYSLAVKEPVAVGGESEQWEVPMIINVKPNQNMDLCAEYVRNTLKSISLTKEEKANYEKLKKPVFSLIVTSLNQTDTIYLRKNQSFSYFNRLENIWFYTHSFYLSNGLREIRNDGIIQPGEEFFTPINKSPYYGSIFSLNFIHSSENRYQVVYAFSDYLSLNEIAKVTKYEIFQDTIRYEFLFGGFRLKDELSKINLILSPDLTTLTFNIQGVYDPDDFVRSSKNYIKNSVDSIILTVNEANYMGFNNWRLIKQDELSFFLSNYLVNNFDNELFIAKHSHGSHESYMLENSILSGTEERRPNPNVYLENPDYWIYLTELERSLSVIWLAHLKDRQKDNKPNQSLEDYMNQYISGYSALEYLRKTKPSPKLFMGSFRTSHSSSPKTLILVRDL